MKRKQAFDAVDDLFPGIWNLPGSIALFDKLLDMTGGSDRQAANDTEFDRAVIDHLRREEGVRSKAYKDHLGYWTIGVGRLIDSRKGGRITPEEDAILMANDPGRKGKPWTEYVLTDPEINMLLLNDVARFVAAIEGWPAWKKVEGNVARRVALLSMAFQMGHVGLSKFKNSLRMVEQGRYADAADNFMKSKWARQTRSRALRVTQMIRTGLFS